VIISSTKMNALEISCKQMSSAGIDFEVISGQTTSAKYKVGYAMNCVNSNFKCLSFLFEKHKEMCCDILR